MGWGSGVAVSCGVGQRCSLDLAWPWLWRRPGAEVLFFFFCLFVFLSFVVVVAISWAAPAAYGGSQARG